MVDVFDELQDLWPLGVRVDKDSVTLLDQDAHDFKCIRSNIPGSATGLAGAASRVLETLEAVKAKWKGAT